MLWGKISKEEKLVKELLKVVDQLDKIMDKMLEEGDCKN